MLRAYLYNTENHKLERLDDRALLESSPDNDRTAADAKRNGATSTFGSGKVSCRANEFVWVDLTEPSADELTLITRRFGLHPVVVEDLQAKENRPKLHDYADYLYIIFHALTVQDGDAAGKHDGQGRDLIEFQEIDCLVGADYVVTIHDRPVPPFDDLSARWERHPELMDLGPGYLLYELMDEVLDDYFPALDHMDERIDELETKLFIGGQSGVTSDIFGLKRDLLEIRRIAGPTRDVVNVLLRHDAETGNRHFVYLQDLYDHSTRIVDMVDTFRDVLSGALDAYLAVESNRMNDVMKTLTAASIILLVPNLIAAIYGMNFKYMPELQTRFGYFVVLGVMACAMLGLAALFKRKGWL